MADPFVAEVRVFPFNFAPKGWAWCDGQLMPISQNTALFSLVGTFYGGDGKSTFALPDLQGRAAMHAGDGPGLSSHTLGEDGGSETVTLTDTEIPSHGHAINSNLGSADLQSPSPLNSMAEADGFAYKQAPFGPTVTMAPETLTPAGGDLPHNNLQPYLTFYFCIALQGVFPPRG
jgi:microcystin-dependent protein